ncbi:hypothetical protein APHAL10511_000144 [Amanita phalloides]|nr:hypothetical protein APHAL10511_000144 [Amanita phalloides]
MDSVAATDIPREFRKKDGTPSKMRNHKGNIPVLPQTKLCPHCPAKFTRTTHLNRHLRTHTNERLHHCDTCNAKFTRSDLLTRHRKSCNESTSRTRRKSCISCMESKIKCDRQYPCSKCVARGRECLFANSVKSEPILASQHFLSATRTEPFPPAIGQRLSNSTAHGMIVNSSYHSSTSYSRQSHPLEDPQVANVLSVGNGGYASPIYTTSDTTLDYSAASDIETTAEAGRLAPMYSHLSSLYPSDMFEPLFSNLFSQQASTSATTISEDIAWFGDPRSSSPEDFPFATSPLYRVPVDVPLPGSYVSPIIQPVISDMHNLSLDGEKMVNGPAEPELEHYMYLFFTSFMGQIPIFHLPTFNLGNAPPILLNAMRACGALYVKTRRAMQFILQTLASARETLLQEFAKNPTDSSEQIYLILAVVLLQTIGLFHQQANQRASSNTYHSMLVMMIQNAGLITKNTLWHPTSTDKVSHEAMWQEWSWHEMTKRALWWSYMHDCCHGIYFGLRMTYDPTEIQLNLPCEDALWQAKCAADWFTVLQTASGYGANQTRLTGFSFYKSLSRLSETRFLTAHIALNSFAHFVLVHAILRKIFRICAENGEPRVKGGREEGSDEQKIHALQYALHNWLQSWDQSLDKPKINVNDEPPFISNVLPFYWLGQIAILAHQERLPPFEYSTRGHLPEARFRLIKHWLKHIRSFLKKGNQGATSQWDELMKVRLQTSQQDDEEGLLEFFPEH